MSTGLPLVSFDCPRGPGEIIDDGKNGRLVPDGDIPSFTSALLEVIDDRDLRRRLGARALEDARQYEIDAIAAHWEELLERVGGRLRG
jgi:glycosyltransferase involved in cell wall biosynthesis